MASKLSNSLPPCILFEDEHLLVVNKPAGWNTHAPSPFAGEGIYDWFKHREPRWASLAIIHRLDKETSGVLVFGKTPLANRSLTQQFEQRIVRKKYLLLSDRTPRQPEFLATSKIARAGERYISGTHGEPAETKFAVQIGSESGHPLLIEAEPLTGRTHQIRVHAADNGFPIFGDRLYGGSTFTRVCLHAAELELRHPATSAPLTFKSQPDFSADTGFALREAIVEPLETDAFRLIHGASDGWPDWQVERLGDFLLSQSEQEPTELQGHELNRQKEICSARGAYHKILTRQIRRTSVATASPQLVQGEGTPERFTVRENAVKYELSFGEGYSVGLFLDQRDNRRRLLTRHIAAGFDLALEGRVSQVPNPTNDAKPGPRITRPSEGFEILNCFAYTCGFSVCAALGGARTTSLDLSKKYLEWGKRNFALNHLDPAQHDFIYGDTFDWLRRLVKKKRAFDVVLLDPPTFSQSKEGGVFRAEKDYGRLVSAALPVLKPGGVLFASTNAAEWKPEDFLAQVEAAIRKVGRRVVQQHYAPQPPDFPVSRAEPAYLKTVWLRVA